jgi:putative Mg2+ transporter-C (MgtC) family protein
MDQAIGYIDQLPWQLMFFDTLRMFAAFAIVLPIGFERERSRQLGLRTFPLVAIGSCAYILVATHIIGPDTSSSHPDAHMRLFQGLMTGIGFIGGGAILKSQGEVHGTATAAGIWATGAVGAAVAYDRYGIAIVISAVTYLTLQFLTPFSITSESGNQQPSGDEKSADSERRD